MEPIVEPSLRPLIAILASLVAVPLIVASGRRPNLRDTWSVLAALVKAGVVLSMLPDVLAGRMPTYRLWDVSPGIALELRVDTLGLVFAIVSSVLWVLTSFYAIGYVRGAGEKKQTRFFASFALSLASAVGIAFAGNLLTFLIFFEMLTLATYPLVLHKETDAARRGGEGRRARKRVV